MQILKRDGRVVNFNRQKIVDAIHAAFDNTDNELFDEYAETKANNIADYIEQKIKEDSSKKYSVEDIQDLVENGLMSCKKKNVAKEYILYRQKRSEARKNTIDDSIRGIVNMNDPYWESENANKNPRLNSTQRDYMAGEVSKDAVERYLLPKIVVEANKKGIIHFHDADYALQHEHNCFTGGTKFITEDGIKRFCDYKDGETVYVKDRFGNLAPAIVHKYGKQKMQDVYLKAGCRTKKVTCTPNHRWYLKDGSVTTDLKIGDTLFATMDSTNYEITNKTEAFAFCMGFIVGDGVDHGNSTEVRLCGSKIKYADYFRMAGFSVNERKNTNDLYARIHLARKQDFLNGKVWRFMTAPLKALAFKGYYAADGAINANKVCTTDDRVALFIEETSGIAGYYISSCKTEIRDTNYKKDSKLLAYHFVVSTPVNLMWKVVDIKSSKHGTVDAWCVEEPESHSFTLDGGIVTGNCDLINLDDMLQNGTVISEVMIEKPKSFLTACTVTTQIIAQVASSQYGGQSISLEHLAPFVDVSRHKIRLETISEWNEEGIEYTEEQLNHVVEKKLKKEIKSGIQTIQYQLVTIETTNGQAPFITIFMYLNEARDEQTKHDLAMLIEEMLKQRIQGVKNEDGVYIAPAFPKLIYCLESDNIHEGDKYWYLTRLAAECSAKRLVPDYISEKKMIELKGDVYTCINKICA